MSFKALDYVIEYSPYKGVTRFVHVLLGNIANDQHDHRVWLSQERLAKQAKVDVRSVSRAIAKLLKDGYLEKVDDHHGRYGATTYRFVFKPVAADYPGVVPIYDKRRAKGGHPVRSNPDISSTRASSMNKRDLTNKPRASNRNAETIHRAALRHTAAS